MKTRILIVVGFSLLIGLMIACGTSSQEETAEAPREQVERTLGNHPGCPPHTGQ